MQSCSTKHGRLSMLLGLSTSLGVSATRLMVDVDRAISQRADTSIGMSVSTGQCSDDDMKLINKMGSGSQEGSFGYLNNECGHKSWQVLPPKFESDEHVKCLQKHLPISGPCGQCFAAKAKYGFDECKWDCLTNWCSQGCLKCVAGQKDALKTCVGSEPPVAYACDGSGYNVPTNHTPSAPDSPKADENVPTDAPSEDGGVPASAPFVQTGKCTLEDKLAMEKAGAGPAAGSFAATCADCGSSSLSWTLSFEEDKYKTCLRGKVPISDGCSSCFADSGRYGLNNCKMACMSSWCGKGCLECVDNHYPDLKKCVGFDPPSAWACDGSGYGQTTVTTTKPAFAWQPANALPLGHNVSLYNSGTGKFIHMFATYVGSGKAKSASDAIEDGERFTVVDASGDGSGESIALYNKAHNSFVTLKDSGALGLAASSDTPPPEAQFAVYSVAGSGNVKAVALGPAGDVKHVIGVDSQGALASTGMPKNDKKMTAIMDSEESTTFVVVDEGKEDSTGGAAELPVPSPHMVADDSAAVAPSTTFLGAVSLALLATGTAGGYYWANSRLARSAREVGY